jgi:hypothetical protein
MRKQERGRKPRKNCNKSEDRRRRVVPLLPAAVGRWNPSVWQQVSGAVRGGTEGTEREGRLKLELGRDANWKIVWLA